MNARKLRWLKRVPQLLKVYELKKQVAQHEYQVWYSPQMETWFCPTSVPSLSGPRQLLYGSVCPTALLDLL